MAWKESKEGGMGTDRLKEGRRGGFSWCPGTNEMQRESKVKVKRHALV